MARIRTIKPEFPQSESVGKLSRDARLLFIQIWTIVDDAGRARASSRMLASLLYPYDDDAKDLMEGWLDQLERGDHVRRYEVDGSQYLEVVKWLDHQKIDKPTKSRLPEFSGNSRIVAKPREGSSTDLGPRTMDLGPSTVDSPLPPQGDGVVPIVAPTPSPVAAPSGASAPTRTKNKPRIPLPDDFASTPGLRERALAESLPADEFDEALKEYCQFWWADGRSKNNWAYDWSRRCAELVKKMKGRRQPQPTRDDMWS